MVVPLIKLVIGNKNYSSWSLRAWLYLQQSNIPFEEIRIPLFSKPGWRERVTRFSPAGRVPILIDGDETVWDSLAIIEYLRQKHSAAVSWPPTPSARARAWSIAAEMHSGFLAVRAELPQNLRNRRPIDPSELSVPCREQIQRIDQIWSEALQAEENEGPWLFGEFSIADVMFAPVALRFDSYSIPVSAAAAEFMANIKTLEPVLIWIQDAIKEPEEISFIDTREPVANTPMVPG